MKTDRQMASRILTENFGLVVLAPDYDMHDQFLGNNDLTNTSVNSLLRPTGTDDFYDFLSYELSLCKIPTYPPMENLRAVRDKYFRSRALQQMRIPYGLAKWPSPAMENDDISDSDDNSADEGIAAYPLIDNTEEGNKTAFKAAVISILGSTNNSITSVPGNNVEPFCNKSAIFDNGIVGKPTRSSSSLGIVFMKPEWTRQQRTNNERTMENIARVVVKDFSNQELPSPGAYSHKPLSLLWEPCIPPQFLRMREVRVFGTWKQANQIQILYGCQTNFTSDGNFEIGDPFSLDVPHTNTAVRKLFKDAANLIAQNSRMTVKDDFVNCLFRVDFFHFYNDLSFYQGSQKTDMDSLSLSSCGISRKKKSTRSKSTAKGGPFKKKNIPESDDEEEAHYEPVPKMPLLVLNEVEVAPATCLFISDWHGHARFLSRLAEVAKDWIINYYYDMNQYG